MRDAADLPGRDRRRVWRRLADVLLIAGGLVLAYPFWSAGYAQVQQGRLGGAYQAQAASFAAVEAARPPHREVPPQELTLQLAVAYGRTLDAGEPIGRLKIPRIGVNRIIQQGEHGAGLDPGDDTALLRAGPVHYEQTPLPGAGRPFAIAGHRTTYGAPFYRLDELEPGDAIYVDTPYARFRYAVAKTTIVLPVDVSVLADRGYDLVLTTCTPKYSASHRLIVWASLTSVRPAPPTGG